MTTLITREAHPHLWSFFTLVSATMQLSYPSRAVTVDVASDDVAVYEESIAHWPLRDVAVLAGVFDDDQRFGELVSTEVGSFVNHVLAPTDV